MLVHEDLGLRNPACRPWEASEGRRRPLKAPKAKKSGSRGSGSRGLFSASQKAGLLKDAESGPRFAPSSEASGTLPPDLGKPAKDEEGHFKARRKALKGSKRPQKSVKKGSKGLFSAS